MEEEGCGARAADGEQHQHEDEQELQGEEGREEAPG